MPTCPGKSGPLLPGALLGPLRVSKSFLCPRLQQNTACLTKERPLTIWTPQNSCRPQVAPLFSHQPRPMVFLAPQAVAYGFTAPANPPPLSLRWATAPWTSSAPAAGEPTAWTRLNFLMRGTGPKVVGGHDCGSTPMGSHFGVGAQLILEPIFSGD